MKGECRVPVERPYLFYDWNIVPCPGCMLGYTQRLGPPPGSALLRYTDTLCLGAWWYTHTPLRRCMLRYTPWWYRPCMFVEYELWTWWTIFLRRRWDQFSYTVTFILQVLFTWFEKLPFGYTVDSFIQDVRAWCEQGYVNTDVLEAIGGLCLSRKKSKWTLDVHYARICINGLDNKDTRMRMLKINISISDNSSK